VISGASQLRDSMSADFYQNLLKEDLDPSIVETIKIDLPRTFPDNIFFKTMDEYQSRLFNVLAAYAHHNPQVGYCQVSSIIIIIIISSYNNKPLWFSG